MNYGISVHLGSGDEGKALDRWLRDACKRSGLSIGELGRVALREYLKQYFPNGTEAHANPKP